MTLFRNLMIALLLFILSTPIASAQVNNSSNAGLSSTMQEVVIADNTNPAFSITPKGGILRESTDVMVENPNNYDIRYSAGVSPREPDCILSPRFTRTLFVKTSLIVKVIACDSYRQVGNVVTHKYTMERPNAKRRALTGFRRGTQYTVRPIRTRFFGENLRPDSRQDRLYKNDPLNNSPKRDVTEESLLSNLYFTVPQGTYNSSFITYFVAPKGVDVRYETGENLDNTAEPVCGLSSRMATNSFKIDESKAFKFVACRGDEAINKVRSISYLLSERQKTRGAFSRPSYTSYKRPVRSRVRFRSQTMKGRPIIKTF